MLDLFIYVYLAFSPAMNRIKIVHQKPMQRESMNHRRPLRPRLVAMRHGMVQIST